MFVEPGVVIAMTSLHLSVMTRRSRANKLMKDTLFMAKAIESMNSCGILEMSELEAVVRLNRLRLVAKVIHRHLYELYRRIGGLLFEGE